MRLWPRKQVYLDDLPRTHDIRFLGLFLVLLLALLGGLYTVGFFVAGDRLARGASVAGIDIGGMREGEARTTLQTKLLPRLTTPIKATALGKTFSIDVQRAGLTFDVDATLAQGLGSSRWDPSHMLDVVLGGEAIDPIVDVDEAALAHTLKHVAAQVEQPPVDSKVAFVGGRPAVTIGHDGTRLDTDAAGKALRKALLDGDDEVSFTVDPVSADVTAAEANAFVARVATPAVSGPVRITVADVTRTVPVHVFAPALRVSTVDGRLVLTIDSAALHSRSRSVLASLPHHPSNARIAFRNGSPTVVPSTSGVSVAADDWSKAVLRAVEARGAKRVARANVTPDLPAFSTADARGLKIDQRLASVTLPVTANIDPAAVVVAASRLNGYVVRPNGDFTYLGRVGSASPTADSLVASAAYAAAFRSGMGQLVRSTPRTSTIGSEPGLDAAVAPGIDLAWVNHTPYGVYLRATVESDGGRQTVTVSLWSHSYGTVAVSSSGRYNVVAPPVDRESGSGCRTQRGVPGYDVDVSRRIARPGAGASTERTHSHYEVVPEVVCRGRR